MVIIPVASTLLAYSNPPANLVETVYIDHPPFKIVGDDQFLATASIEGWPGNGSLDDPFVILGLDINGGNLSQGTSISDVNLSFEVAQCYFHNFWYGYYALYLRNVQHVTISLNTFVTSGCGVLIVNCSEVEVANNEFTSCGRGVCPQNCEGINVENNAFMYCEIGIGIYSCSNSTFQSNSCTQGIYGIRTEDSESLNVTLSSNICSHNSKWGIISSGMGCTIRGNNCSFNTYCGILINANSYFANVSLNTLWGNTDRGIRVTWFTHNVTIWNNTLAYNYGTNDTYNWTRGSQAYDIGNSTKWNVSGTPHGWGNYWRDWTSPDDDHDGIVDEPYPISSRMDYYPHATMPTPPTPIPEYSSPSLMILLAAAAVVLIARARRSRR